MKLASQSSLQLILASKSPRRRELLNQIGIKYKVIEANIDESRLDGETASVFVERLALEKALKVFHHQPMCSLPILGADTVVSKNAQIYGKPKNINEGIQMLSELSDATHEVITAVALVNSEKQQVISVSSEVTFSAISYTQQVRYWNSGEPADKAGGYAIQGLGAVFVANLNGSFSNVMGLPLFETAQLLEQFNISTL